MITVDTFDEVRRETSDDEAALVPTMGFLHEGHVSLLELARETADVVVMSLFVNPLQFDDPGDLDRYPRDPARDAAMAEDAGVDVLFAPTVEEMYPDEPLTTVAVRQVSDGMEGRHRPGHFEGVATVVAKLFAGIRPTTSVFGRKDAQQLAVVRRMAFDLSFPIEVVAAPVVRDVDGLALSSRNVLLGSTERRIALSLSQGLAAAAALASRGERAADALKSAVRDTVVGAGADLEYVELADAATAAPVVRVDREAFLAVAARVGGVRLIDNVALWPDGSVDTGIRLSVPSSLGKE